MYQPHIRADLISRLYRQAKAQGIPMTRLVSELLEGALANLERGDAQVSEPPAAEYQPTPNPPERSAP